MFPAWGDPVLDGFALKTGLQAIRERTVEIARKEDQLERARALAERITAAMGGESVASSKSKTPMENAADRAMTLEAEIADLKAKNEQEKRVYSAMIDGLQLETYRKVLEGIYFDCKTKKMVAKEIGYTERHIYNILDWAIAELETVNALICGI